MRDFGVFVKFVKTRICGHVWLRDVRQNSLRRLDFKCILIGRWLDLSWSVFVALNSAYFLSDFPLVPLLKNLLKCTILAYQALPIVIV